MVVFQDMRKSPSVVKTNTLGTVSPRTKAKANTPGRIFYINFIFICSDPISINHVNLKLKQIKHVLNLIFDHLIFLMLIINGVRTRLTTTNN